MTCLYGHDVRMLMSIVLLLSFFDTVNFPYKKFCPFFLLFSRDSLPLLVSYKVPSIPFRHIEVGYMQAEHTE